MPTPRRVAWISALFLFQFSLSPIAFSDVIDDSTGTVKEEIVSEEVVVEETFTPAKQEAAAEEAIAPTSMPVTEVSAAETTPEAKAEEKAKTEVVVGGGGFFLNRKDYKLLQPQNEGMAFASQSAGEPFEYQLDGVGAFGDIYVEHPINDCWSIGASFLGASLERSQDRDVPGGTTFGTGGFIDNGTVLPLLNNSMRQRQIAGFDTGSAIEIGGRPNSPNEKANTHFEYATKQFDLSLDLIKKNLFHCKVTDVKMDGIIGFAYTRLTQDTNLDTRGINVNNDGLTTTETAEYLRDDLYGGHFGVRAKKAFNKCLRLEMLVLCGLFADVARYDATQAIHNGSFPGFVGAFDFTVKQILENERFAPRLDVRPTLIWDINSQWSLGAAYTYSGLFNLSNIDHPAVVVKNQGGGGFNDQIDHDVRIGSENVSEHFIELKLGYVF